MNFPQKFFSFDMPVATDNHKVLTGIFNKLRSLDANLPYQIFDDAFRIHKEQRDRPQLLAEFQQLLDSETPKDIDNISLRKSDPPPKRIKDNMNDPRPARMSMPLSFSKDMIAADDFVIDMNTIDNDICLAISQYAAKNSNLLLTSKELRTLKI